MEKKIWTCLTLMLLLASCQSDNTPPIAFAYSIPGIGDSTTIFLLEGEKSSDKESSYFVLRYRWDTDGDGNWDTDFSTRSSTTIRFKGTGYQRYFLEVADADGSTALAVDSVFILSSNQQTDTLTDERDGKHYPIVKIGGTWWMAENLQYGTRIETGTLGTNNDQAEYFWFNNSSNFADYGALYTWTEANYYPQRTVFRDICPNGWRIPTPDQWASLFKSYPVPFDVLYYFGKQSTENLGIGMTGYYKFGDPKNPMKGEFLAHQTGVRYWTSEFTGADTTRFYTSIRFSRDAWDFVQSFNRTEWIFHPVFGYIIGYRTPESYYVRCIRK